MQYAKLPNPIRASVRTLKYARKSGLRLFGAYHPRHCTICGHSGRFYSYGFPREPFSRPSCLSLERHRALAICANQQPLFEGKDILHFAPEPGLTAFIRGKGVRSYKTCDMLMAMSTFASTSARSIFPISPLTLAVLYAFDVLEHVPDDRKAMAELRRILRPSGMAVVMVPMEEGLDETYEFLLIISPGDRLIHFGQEDHVRYYGRDIRDRLRDAKVSICEGCRDNDTSSSTACGAANASSFAREIE